MLLLELTCGLMGQQMKVRKAGGLKQDPQSPHQEQAGDALGMPPLVDLPFHFPGAALLGCQLSFQTG